MTGSKRILMVCTQHSPFDGRVFHLEAKTLRDAGHEVTILAESDTKLPENVDGINIVTYRKKPSGIRRKWSTLKTVTSNILKIKADVFHVHEVDASLMAASWAKRKLGKQGKNVPIVFDSHEAWPYFYAEKTKNRFLRELIKHGVMQYEYNMISKHVKIIITAHELEANYYRMLNPWIPVYEIPGGPPIHTWPDPPKKEGKISVIGHDGYFTLYRGMKTILEAFEIVAVDYPDINLLAAGDFYKPGDKEYFDRWSNRTGLGNRVECAGWVDRKDILSYLDRMDIGVVANKPDIHSIRCWPANKMMYYLGRGLPVVSTPTPLYKLHIERLNCGLPAKYFSSKAMADALRWMLENPLETREMGKRGLKAAQEEFSWEKAGKKLLEAYENIDKPVPFVDV